MGTVLADFNESSPAAFRGAVLDYDTATQAISLVLPDGRTQHMPVPQVLQVDGQGFLAWRLPQVRDRLYQVQAAAVPEVTSLEQLQGGTPPAGKAPKPGSRKKALVIGGIALLLVLALGGAVAWYFLSPKDGPAPQPPVPVATATPEPAPEPTATPAPTPKPVPEPVPSPEPTATPTAKPVPNGAYDIVSYGQAAQGTAWVGPMQVKVQVEGNGRFGETVDARTDAKTAWFVAGKRVDGASFPAARFRADKGGRKDLLLRFSGTKDGMPYLVRVEGLASK